MPSSSLRLAAVVLLLPGLAGCGGDSSAESGRPSGTAASAASSADQGGTASSASPTDGTPAPEGSSAAEGRLAGEGYSFVLPDGWQDATEQFQEYSELIDAGAVNADQAGQPFSDNVNVLRNAARAELPPAQAEHQFVEELRTVARRVEVQRPARVDGVDALHLTGRTEAGGVTALTEQYIVFVEDAYYVLTFSYGTGTPTVQREDEVAAMLRSWAWD